MRPKRCFDASRIAATVVVLAAVVQVVGCRGGTAPEPTAPKVLVLVVVDTLRADGLSVYGAKTAPPNIDALASQGTVFRNARSSFHQTTMSMGAMFTGRTPSIESGTAAEAVAWNGSTWCGLARFASASAASAPGSAKCVPDTLPTLAQRLREAGYKTIGVVSNELLFRPAGFDRGFDQWLEIGREWLREGAGGQPQDGLLPGRGRPAKDVNEAALAALPQKAADEKLFLYVHYLDVHDWFLSARSYSAAVERFDSAFGRLMAELDKRGFLDDAAVVFTSDHGEALGERHAIEPGKRHFGNPSFTPVLHVPLIVRPSGLVEDVGLIRTQDIFSLVRKIAGAGDGTGEQQNGPLAKDELYLSEVFYQTHKKGDWKAIRARGSKRAWLFNLATDPGETRDVSQEHPDRLRAHLSRIDELATELSVTAPIASGLRREDENRLRALGYLN